jgi:Uma2 family endonuclease
MTLAAVEPATSPPVIDRNRLRDQQHFAMSGAPWSLYEQLIEAAGNRQIRITFNKGDLEIMAPLHEHELGKTLIGRLVEFMAFERNIPLIGYGSSTYRREDRQVGLEPDECYYVGPHTAAVRGMKKFDAAIHPPPDLAIEVDITARSVAREPVYAELGVPELWRYDGARLTVLLLDAASRQYRTALSSAAFPFLPVDRFEAFIHRMELEEQTAVLREFQAWLRTLASS